MAHAVRKVWLEPEEHPSEALTPQLTPRRQRAPQSATFWHRPTLGGLLVAGLLTGLLVYTFGQARVAQLDIRRQHLQRELAGLQRECVDLRLESERLHAQPGIQTTAKAEGLELPAADRVHYVRVTDPASPTAMAQAPARTDHPGWVATSGQQLVASLDQALQHLGRGPGEPAYAQQ